MKRYSAKLLFQWRSSRSPARKRRLTEERIVTFQARSARSALGKAKRAGREGQTDFEVNGVRVRQEFIGVMELIDVTHFDDGDDAEFREVWYQLVERVQPSGKRGNWIPHESRLEALRAKIPNRKHHLKAW